MKRSHKVFMGFFLVYLVYISLGVPDSILGVAWPSIQEDYGVPISFGSIVVAVVTILAAISSLSYTFVERRLRTGYIVFFSSLLTTIGLVGIGLSKSFAMLCASAIPMGIGAGAVDATVNNYVSKNLSAKHMIWLHGFWGVGAVVGPLAYGALQSLNAGWNLSSLIIAGVQGTISLVLLINVKTWDSKNKEKPTAPVQSAAEKLKVSSRMGAFLRVLFTFLFSGLDITISLWLSTYLINTNRATLSSAGLLMAAYYAAVTGGRFIIGILTSRVGFSKIIISGLFVACIGLGLSLFGSSWVLLIGVVTLGIGLAPIHPFTLYETHQAYAPGFAEKVTSFQISASLIGGLAIPALVGVLITDISMAMMPIIQMSLIILLIVLRAGVIKQAKEM